MASKATTSSSSEGRIRGEPSPADAPEFRNRDEKNGDNEDDDDDEEEEDDGDDGGSLTASFQPENPYPTIIPRVVGGVDEDGRKKKSCLRSNCVNGSLIALKTLLFIFYGGIGTIATWLNHEQLSARFAERESCLIYGISALLSLFTPVAFGLFSDKSAQPKKVLGLCLVLSALLYPLLLTVPPAEPYRYRDKLSWCGDLASEMKAVSNSSKSSPKSQLIASSCLPNRLSCGASETHLITDLNPNDGGSSCSDSCSGRIIISRCEYKCNYDEEDEEDDAEDDYKNPPSHHHPSFLRSPLPQHPPPFEEDENRSRNSHPPHLCVKNNPSFKYKNLCFAFDKDMHEIVVPASDLKGFVERDGKCHYPLQMVGDEGEKTSQLSCSPLASHCTVSCDLRWDTGSNDQWTCQSDFIQWLIAFASFVAIHTLGTMLVITAAGLLNSAILSMSHEHSGYFGCQFTYAALGFALCPPGVLLLMDYLHSVLDPIPWRLEYFGAYALWLLACALLSLCLPYHAEWVPKPKTVGPMLRRWSSRGHNLMFFALIVVLGACQVLNDVLSYHQILSVGASPLILSLCATASILPALVFIFRVERVVEYCGHQNLFSIALVVFSLQFTGYASLENCDPKWSFLLKAMETFSVFMVWISASYTTYSSAPRSLAATCQCIIATLYCSIGRGLGGLLGFVGLSLVPKPYFLKGLSLLSVFICVIYLTLHYCCLKPFPYTKQYEHDRPGSAAPSGRYTPLKLINGNKDRNLAKDEDLDEKEIGSADDL